MTLDRSEDAAEDERLSVVSRPKIAQPIHELALHRALDSNATNLFRPGPGRSMFLMQEPQIGFGVPDAVLVQISSVGLRNFRQHGLRLPSLASARSLFAEDASGLTPQHSRTLVRSLIRAGWTREILISSSALLHDSLSVEAKLTDWKRAIRQANNYRVGTNKSAVLMPQSQVKNIDSVNLEYHGIGLMQEINGRIEWVALPRSTPMAPAAKAWLIELLLRGLENGTAHTFSARRNSSSASLNDSTRAW
jgi:hypothetical protein